MKKLRPISEAEVIAEFLKNEYYHKEYHRDRSKFERVVFDGDISNQEENAVRRALLFRRRGSMWRELPADTQWWEVEMDAEDLQRVRVFPRAQWRKLSQGSFHIADIVERVKAHNGPGPRNVLTKINQIRYRLSQGGSAGTVMLIGLDEQQPLTILEGNHRLTAALLASPQDAPRRYRVFCGLSPRMRESCWYHTSFANLMHFLRNIAIHVYDAEADVSKVAPQIEIALAKSFARAVGAQEAKE